MSTDFIEKKIIINAPISRVWQAISNSSEFGAWFGVKFDEPFLPGKAICGVLVGTSVDPEIAAMQTPYAGMPFNLTVETMKPETVFAFRWHPYGIDPNKDYSGEPTTLVTFTLTESEGGVLLTLVESGFDNIPLERRAQAFAANEGGWAIQATLVKRYVEGGS